MITFFSSPRPFTNSHFNIIQRNAIQSWTKIPHSQVLLLGNDTGTSDVAKEYGCTHLPKVEITSSGMPWRDSIFKTALQNAKNDLVCFMSSDIIIVEDFTPLLKHIPYKHFLLGARRWDLNITKKINFETDEWKNSLRQQIKTEGTLHGPTAIDFALYPKKITPAILPHFPINLPAWDGWFYYQHKKRHIPIINAHTHIALVHQNHDTLHDARKKRNVWQDNPEAKSLLKKAGGFSSLLSLRESDFILTPKGLTKPPHIYRILSLLGTTKLYRKLLGTKRWFQQYTL
jgi:hypothetical protein